MPDFLSVVERGLKAVRYGIFQASDNLAMLLDGFCRAPEDPAVVATNERVAGAIAYARNNPPSSAAGSPQNAAVVAPSPKQGSDSGSEEIDAFPRVPSEPPSTFKHPIADVIQRMKDAPETLTWADWDAFGRYCLALGGRSRDPWTPPSK